MEHVAVLVRDRWLRSCDINIRLPLKKETLGTLWMRDSAGGSGFMLLFRQVKENDDWCP